MAESPVKKEIVKVTKVIMIRLLLFRDSYIFQIGYNTDFYLFIFFLPQNNRNCSYKSYILYISLEEYPFVMKIPFHRII